VISLTLSTMLVQLLPLVEFNTLCPADNAKSLQR
jgi:hypothetical protein